MVAKKIMTLLFLPDRFKDVITLLYIAFNSKDIDTILELVDKDVWWPMNWSDHSTSGKSELADFWQTIWKEGNMTIIPLLFDPINKHKLKVKVFIHHTDLKGVLLFEGVVCQEYLFDNALIKKMKNLLIFDLMG